MTQNDAMRAMGAFNVEEGGDFRYGAGEEETLKGKIIKASAASLLAFICVSIILAIVVLIQAAVVSSVSSPMVGVMQFVEENMEVPPIFDIRIGNGSYCSAGYNLVQIGTWPGTDTGCFCPGALYNQLTKGACTNSSSNYALASKYDDNATALRSQPTEQQLDWGDTFNYIAGADYSCRTVYGKSSHKLTNWRSNSFCVRYYAAGDYRWTGRSCGSGYQRCQRGLCVRSTLPCPVTDIDYSQSSYTGGGRSRTYVSFNISRDTSDPGILKLQIEQDGVPCLANGQQPKSQGYAYYPLLSNTPNGCGKYGQDEASIILDTEPEADLYNENGLGYAVATLPTYAYYLSGRKSSLYARQRLEVNTNNDNCLNLETIYFKEAASGFATIGGTIITLAVFSMLCGCASGCCTASAFKGQSTTLWNLGKSMKNPLSFIGTTIVMILFLVAFVKVETAHSKISRGSRYFEVVSNWNCFKNAQVSQALLDFSDAPDSSSSLDSTVLVSFVILVALYAVHLVGFIIVQVSPP